MIRHRPEDHGELPDGEPPVSEAESDTGVTEAAVGQRDFTAREAMRTHSFWLISLGHALALLTVSAVMVHLIAHLTESLDYSVAEAGGVVALLTGFMMLGQLSGGYLGDRFNKRLICAICMVAHAAGLLLVTFAGSFPQPVLLVLAFTVLHGLAWGTRGPLMVALRADYFRPQFVRHHHGLLFADRDVGDVRRPGVCRPDGGPVRELRNRAGGSGGPVAARFFLLSGSNAAEAQAARGRTWKLSGATAATGGIGYGQWVEPGRGDNHGDRFRPP